MHHKKLCIFLLFVSLSLLQTLWKHKIIRRTWEMNFKNHDVLNKHSHTSSSWTIQIKGEKCLNQISIWNSDFLLTVQNTKYSLAYSFSHKHSCTYDQPTRYGTPKCANVNNNFIFNVFKTVLLLLFYTHTNSLNSHLNKCHKTLSMLTIMGATHFGFLLTIAKHYTQISCFI